jgi:serralysin
VLTGGSSWDKFVFDTKLDGSVDKITDFFAADDSIYLDNAIFQKLGADRWAAR